MTKKKIKAEVLKGFRNKYTKSLHQAGDFLYISENRLEEINSTRYGKLVKRVGEETAEEGG
jgi:hypothetical protein